MKVTLKQARYFDTGAFSGHVWVGKENNAAFNCLLVDCVTGHYKTKLKGATRVYVVMEGEGTFTINGKQYSAEPHDCFVISDGDVYEYQGRMKLIEFNTPATDQTNEEKLD